jgi:hypothetical protein
MIKQGAIGMADHDSDALSCRSGFGCAEHDPSITVVVFTCLHLTIAHVGWVEPESCGNQTGLITEEWQNLCEWLLGTALCVCDGISVGSWNTGRVGVPFRDGFPLCFGFNPGSCEPDCILSIFVFEGVVPARTSLMINQEKREKKEREDCVDGEHFGVS